MAFVTDIRHAEENFLNTLRNALSNFRARRAQRAAYVNTLKELEMLDDRELADLGIHRIEIPRIAREAAETI
ncbi:MAG: DUF1127 domain-containing protein [Paracoccaceae bacterium]